MSGNEMKYIQEAFDQNWVVPLGPNVNKFEEELKRFAVSPTPQNAFTEDYPRSIMPHEDDRRSCGQSLSTMSGSTANRWWHCRVARRQSIWLLSPLA